MQLMPSAADTTCGSLVTQPGHLTCYMSTSSLRSNRAVSRHGVSSGLGFSTPELCSDPDTRRRQLTKAKLSDCKPLSRKDIFYSGNLRKMYESQQLNHNTSCEHESREKVSGDETETESIVADTSVSSVRLAMQFSMLRNGTFFLFMMSSVLWTAHSSVLTILPDYARLKGYTGQHGALLMSVIGLTNTVGRVLAGWLADRPTVTAISVNSAALLVGGITCLAYSVTDDYTLLVVEAAVFGLCMATWTSLRPIVLVELFGIDNLTNAFGWLAMFQGAAFCVGPPLAGSLFEYTKSYQMPFILAGCAFTTSGLLSLFISRRRGGTIVRRARSSDTDSSEVTESQ